MKRPLATTLLAVLCLSAEAADPGPLTLTPQPGDPDRPWTLSWESSPGTLYQIEHATNLAQPGPWRFEDAVVASSRASKLDVPGRTSAAGAEFWRVSLTPRLLDLQPAFLDPADPDAALELFGQGLPTNATVRLNGQPVPSSPSPNPDAWRLIRAADLPPGLTDIRSVTVLAGTNIIATLHLYLPVALGAVPPPELLQGPAPEPPASPRAGGGSLNTRQKRWLTSNFRLRIDGLDRVCAGNNGDDDGASEDSGQKKWLTSNFRLRIDGLDNASRVGEDFLDDDSDDDALPETAAQKKWLTSNFRLRLAADVKPPPYRYDRRDDDCDGRVAASGGSGTRPQKRWLTSNFRLRIAGGAQPPPAWNDRRDDDCDGRERVAPVGTTASKQKVWHAIRDVYSSRSRLSGDCDDREDGVFAATGELRLQQADLVVPGRGPGFAWVRTYRSRTGPDTPQGAGWDFSYNVSLTPQSDGTLVLRPGNGRADTFYPTGTNTWVRDEYFCEVRDLNADGMPDVVFADTGRWMFHPAGGPAAGRLHQIIDRHGNTTTLEYNAAGLLTAVLDDLGRTHPIDYDPAGRIARVRDAFGRTVRYEYDGDGNLAAVISPAVTGTPTRNDFPGGLTNRFAYTQGFADPRLNHNLTRWTDPKDQAWLSVSYHPDADPASLDFDTVTRLAQGTSTMDWSRAPGTGAKTVRVWVRDALGNVSRATYDSRRRLQDVVDHTGRAPDLNAPVTETSNQPVNKLRPDDPEFFETRWTWNRDSLCTLEIAPDGSRTQFLHEGDLNPAAGARQRGDLRVVRQAAGEAGGGDLDGDGAPDYTERSWRFDYDPRFGSPASMAGSPPLSRHLHSAGIIHRDLAARNVLLGGRAGQGFVTAETDPRGNIHTAAYDAQGNRIELRAAVQALATPPALHFAYNPHGQLAAVTNAPDAAGRRRVDLLQYQTDGLAAGCLRSVTRNAGDADLASTFQLECDERGNVTRLVDPRGADTLATYNALDQCVRVQSPTLLSARSVTDFLYDANGNLVETRTDLRDANDVLQHPVRTLAQYDTLDRTIALSRQTSPGAFLTERVAYDPHGNLTAALSPLAASGEEPDNQVRFEYDERGLLFRVIAAPGSPLALTNSFSYSRTGRGSRLSMRSPSGKSDAYVCARDGFGQVTRITDPMGNVTTLARDRAGQVTRLTTFGELTDLEGDAGNVRLSETGWRYDALGRCTAEQAAFFQPATQQPLSDGARTTTFAYAPNGALVQVTDDRGAVTRLAHDAAGRLASVTDAKTNVLSFSYNPADEVVLVQSEERSDLAPATTTTFRLDLVRDAWGRVTRRTDNVGNARTWAYDSLGRCVQATDPAGTATWAAYDDLGRRTLSIGDLDVDGVPELAADITRSWTYDANSRCVTATDPNTNTTRLTYDARNRLVSTRHPDGTETALIWSPRSNLLRVQDPNGTVVSNLYDRLDRCVGRDITPGPGVAGSTTFERFAYDGLSRLVGATNNGSQVAFAYDSLGHGTATAQDGLVSTATCDALGNPVSLTSPSGLTAVFTHDALGQPVTLGAAPAGQAPRPLLSWAYEGPGRLGRISRTNGINTRLNWNGAVGTPNTPGDLGWRQVSRVNHQRATGGTVIDQRVATFDSRQNRIRRAQTHSFSAATSPVTNDYAYDPRQRLVQAVTRTAAGPASAITYVLDPAGHRLQVLANGTPQAYAMDPTPRPGPADFQAGQYTLTPFGAQAWDDNGNLVSRTSSDGSQTAFSYDYANRLVAVLDLSSGAPVPVATYDYDALGRRIRRTTAGPSPVSPPEVTDYVLMPGGDCDDGNPRELRVNGNPGRVYFWGGADLAVRLTPTGQPEFLHTDDLGNVLALTDLSGNVLERCDYDPFGVPTFLSRDGLPLATNAAPSGNPFLAGGQLHDPETGFYKKGYDYWKTQSSLSSASTRKDTRIVDPFQDVAGTGVLGRAMATWGSRKGYDYYQAQSSLSAIWASRKGYDCWKHHRSKDAEVQSNPLYSDRGHGSNPLFDPSAAQPVNRGGL